MAKSPAVQAVFGLAATRKKRRRSGEHVEVLTRGRGRRKTPIFRRGRSLAGRRLGLQAGAALRLSPGDGKWRRRCRPASRSSGRRQFAPAVLPCRRIEECWRRSCGPWRRTASARGAQQGEVRGVARAQGQGGWGFKGRGRERPCRARQGRPTAC
jgi:hypothetical protein